MNTCGDSVMEHFWEKTLNLLSDRIESQAFDAWIKPLEFVDLERSTLCVEVPDQFFKEWLETHYSVLIKEAARELTKNDIKLQITIRNKSGYLPHPALKDGRSRKVKLVRKLHLMPVEISLEAFNQVS